VAILERARDHRTFRRIRAARLEELVAEARSAPAASTSEAGSDPSSPSAPADSGPPTGPTPSSSDRGTGMGGDSPL